ncbi:Cupin domain-containing protein [Granulicella rosea]|uniref:Cupin domain-containing protein n=1 Tax=Granulicella rosea TaxID=474952 RepID=A0A239EMY2_9BACT|nr:cupin domain-containing protein [Granulicella rosea]SNS45761.1 Cupin domain-containing protein [Granulicella rosea]
MQEMNRRDMLAMAAAFAALGGLAEAQVGPDGKLSQTTVFDFGKLPVKTNATGGASRAVLSGTLPTGEFLEVHETMLPPGQMPHPAHKHRHSEMMLIREGQLEFYAEDKVLPLGPGGVAFAGSNHMHGLKNVGQTPANYFVVAIGVQEK